NNLAFLDESSIIQHIRGFMGVPNPIDESTRALKDVRFQRQFILSAIRRLTIAVIRLFRSIISQVAMHCAILNLLPR
ncbi:MAG: hypothetical protein RR234_10370, partial [Christensenella sp.]